VASGDAKVSVSPKLDLVAVFGDGVRVRASGRSMLNVRLRALGKFDLDCDGVEVEALELDDLAEGGGLAAEEAAGQGGEKAKAVAGGDVEFEAGARSGESGTRGRPGRPPPVP